MQYYQFFDSKMNHPVLADDDKKKGDKQPDKDPIKKDKDDDGDLKHVDQSKGGYGRGSGFDKGE